MKTVFVRFLVALLFAGAGLAAVAPMAVRAEGDVAKCVRLFESGQYEKRREAFPMCKRAGEAGDADAQYNLGEMYYFGIGVAPDEHESWKWYRLAAKQYRLAAEQGGMLGRSIILAICIILVLKAWRWTTVRR